MCVKQPEALGKVLRHALGGMLSERLGPCNSWQERAHRKKPQKKLAFWVPRGKILALASAVDSLLPRQRSAMRVPRFESRRKMMDSELFWDESARMAWGPESRMRER